MFFDEGVLNVICKFIDDPKTFFAFSQMCKRAARVCKLYEERKMDQFVRIKNMSTAGAVHVLRHIETLPNGTKHGLQIFEFRGRYCLLKKKHFNKGKLMAKYFYYFEENVLKNLIIEELTLYNNQKDFNFVLEKLLHQKIVCPNIFKVSHI